MKRGFAPRIGIGPRLVAAFVFAVALSGSIPFLHALSVLFERIDMESRQRLRSDLQVARMVFEQKEEDLSRICAAMANDLTVPKIVVTRNISWIKTWGANFAANFNDRDFTFLLLTDRSGETIFHSVTIGMLGVDLGGLAPVREALSGKESRTQAVLEPAQMAEMGLSRLHESGETTPGLFILVSRPIYEPRDMLHEVAGVERPEEEGGVIGAVMVGYLLNSDRTLLHEIKSRTGGEISLYANNRLVNSTIAEPQFREFKAGRIEELAEREIEAYPERGEMAGYLSRRDPRGKLASVAELRASTRGSRAARVEAVNKSILLLAVGLMVAIGLGMFFTHRITQPIQALIRGAERIGSGALRYKIEIPERDEIGQLARAFNEMSEKLYQSMMEISESHDQLRVFSSRLKEAHNELEIYSKKLEEVNQELLVTNTRLQKANEVKDTFVSTVSHELKTPLTNIIGYSSMMLYGSMGEFTREQMEGIKIIYNRAKMLQSLISDLLSLSHIESGRIVLRKKPLDLKRDFKAIKEVFDQAIKNKNINFQIMIENGISEIYADGNRFQQILFNLIGNALKFTPEFGRIKLSARKNTQDKSVLFTVEDSGVGIDTKDINRVFERFYQADHTDQREYGGTGLGLAIVKELLDLHGGKIWVDSKKGHGTVFYFTLPLEN